MGPIISGGMTFSEVVEAVEADDDFVTKASDIGAANSNTAVTSFEEKIIVSFWSIGVISFLPEYLILAFKLF